MPRSCTLQHIVLALLVLGVLSLLVRVRELPSTMAAAREREALETQTQQLAKAAMRGAAVDAAVELTDAASTEEVVESEASSTPAPAPSTVATEAATPTPQRSKTLTELQALSLCERERDSALLDVIRASQTTLCASSTNSSDADRATAVTLIDVPGGIKATVFSGLELNLAGAKVHKPIKDLSQDGGAHDPRFVFTHNVVHCRCADLVAFAKTERAGQALGLWATMLARVDLNRDAASTLCDPQLPPLAPAAASDKNVVVFRERVILIARRDDHNPFFQVSNALNAYIVTAALGWDLATTRVVHLDSGYPSPVDALHEKLLSPNHALVHGDALMGKRVQFENDVLLAPWEVSGPMMQHLNDDEPCGASALFQDFRRLALATMGAMTAKPVASVLPDNDTEGDDEATESSLSGAAASLVTVTVITRRPYKGRKVQRVWRNEDDVLARMRTEYKDMNIAFQSVDFVALTLQEQMDVIVQSDVVIGMHGAGMVNVFWTRPETLVVEIFPKDRRRWGYRNLCQFIGCDWHEFRGGEDIGKHKEPNSKDKSIPYDAWRAFFDPLLRAKYAQVQEQANDLSD